MFYMLSKTSWTFCNFINFLHVLWLLRCAFYTMLFIDVYPCVYPIFKWFQSAKFYICAYTHTHFSLLVNWLCFTVRMPVYSILISIQFISVTQSCLTLCDPIDCSMPAFPVHHHLLELAQTHVHRVCDTTQSSHSLLSPSSPAFNLSQLQGFSSESVLCIRWPQY